MHNRSSISDRLATNETRTIIVEMSGSFGSVAAFCAGGCAVTEIFDQLGGSPRTWPTAAEQPTLSLSCSDGKPCLTGGGVEFAEGAALPDFASPPTATASYIVFEQEWQCEARSQAQCAALGCDGVATRYGGAAWAWPMAGSGFKSSSVDHSLRAPVTRSR